MPTTRSYSNAFEVVDYSLELQLIPNSWTLLNDSGLFQDEFLSTHTVTFEEQNQTLGLISDQYRGAKPQANKDDIRILVLTSRLLMQLLRKTFKVSEPLVKQMPLKQKLPYWPVRWSAFVAIWMSPLKFHGSAP